MDTIDLRNHIADYLDRIREFNQSVISVDTGIIPLSNYTEFLIHPQALLKLENDFVNQLVHLLNELNRAIQHARQWRIHLENIARNLFFSPIEVVALFEKKKKAIHIVSENKIRTRIESQTDGLSYLRWIVVNTAEELEVLLVDMRALGVSQQGFLDLFIKYQSPELTRWEKALAAWLDWDIDALITSLHLFLNEAGSSPFDTTLHALASYLDVIVNLLTQFSTFSEDFDFLSLKWMSKAQTQFDQLTKAGVMLHELLSLRTQLGTLYVDHELAILNAILPREVEINEWLVMFSTNPAKSAHELLPTDIQLDTLPYALRQAQDALISMETPIRMGEYLLESVKILPTLLKSQVLTKFLNADNERLNLFKEERPKLIRWLRIIQKQLSILEQP
ncbi:MAG: hypothetical protein ACFFD8_03115 [Candidatus Thorarchaeota archaeon]